MWAIVPIKTFERAKQRLADVLSEEERRALMLAMARDVLTCLSRCTELTGFSLFRHYRGRLLAAAFATERFAESPDADLAQALTQATEHLVAHFNARGLRRARRCTGIDPEQVDELIRNNDGITLLPDAEHKGTNGFICAPP